MKDNEFATTAKALKRARKRWGCVDESLKDFAITNALYDKRSDVGELARVWLRNKGISALTWEPRMAAIQARNEALYSHVGEV